MPTAFTGQNGATLKQTTPSQRHRMRQAKTKKTKAAKQHKQAASKHKHGKGK